MAHGVAAALGVHCCVPHGLACAVMLPAALRVNREVRRDDLATLGTLATGRKYASENSAADAFLGFIDEMSMRIGIPERLSEIGVKAGQIPDLVRSARGNSMDGNPRDVSDEELERLLKGML
jgi:alcohol dehydrogenase class IV